MSPQVSLKHDRLAELCRRYRVRRLAVFSSAGREDFDPGRSDLDFLVEFEALSRGVYADTYFGLLEALKQLYGRPVDLIEIGSIRNPYIRQEIETTQETVYGTRMMNYRIFDPAPHDAAKLDKMIEDNLANLGYGRDDHLKRGGRSGFGTWQLAESGFRFNRRSGQER